MNTELVIVKDVMGQALIRCVCHANEKKVFVTSESAFKKLQNGEATVFPIGFDRANVFIYDGRPLPERVDWKRLRLWNGLG